LTPHVIDVTVPPVAEQVERDTQTPLDWILGNGTAALGLLALVIYGVARRGIDGFYGRLNVTAEDVGLNQALITARAALAFVAILAEGTVVASLITLAVALFLLLRRASKAACEGHPYSQHDDVRWRVSSGLCVVVIVGVPAAAATDRTLWSAVIRPFPHLPLSIAYWFVLMGTALFLERTEHRSTIRSLRSRWRTMEKDSLDDPDVPYLLWRERDRLPADTTGVGLSAEAKLGLIAVFAIGAIGLMQLATQVGVNRAENVVTGLGNNPNWGSLAIRADPVCLRWSDPDAKAVLSGGPYMYLGQNGDTMVLYDYLRQDPDGTYGDPLRIPASGVSLHIAISTADSAHWRCPATGEASDPTVASPR